MKNMRHHKPPELLYFPHFYYELPENCDECVLFTKPSHVHNSAISIPAARFGVTPPSTWNITHPVI